MGMKLILWIHDNDISLYINCVVNVIFYLYVVVCLFFALFLSSIR